MRALSAVLVAALWATGGGVAWAQAGGETESEPEPETESETESETETETESESETGTESETESESESESETGTGTGAESGAEAERGDAAGSGVGGGAFVEAPLEVPESPFGGTRRAPAPAREPPGVSPGGSDEAREAGEAASIERREVPRYDGRAPEGTSAEEALLWIPRVLFFPVHLLLEYVIRQPIGFFITTMERERWSELFIDFFTFDERKAGVVPTAFFDFGLQPSVGVYFWANDAGFEGNAIRAQVAFGGVDWLRATLSDRVVTSEETEMGLTVDAWRRPDYVFEGIGWDSDRSRRSRFIRSYVQGRYDFRFRPWRLSEIRFSLGVTWNDFEPGGYVFDTDDGDPSLGDAVRQGFYETPPGFETYTAYHQRLDVIVDSRENRPAPGHGVRLEGYVDQGFDLTSAIERRWMRYGGSLGGFLDVGDNRVFGLSVSAQFAAPLGTAAPVPLNELIVLGGGSLEMSGFLRGQLVGASAVAATLEYRYPIWVFLDGSLHVSVGNVFSDELGDFEFERLRASFGLGLRSVGDRDQSFNVMVAFGTTPFITGGGVDSVRIVIGSQQGF